MGSVVVPVTAFSDEPTAWLDHLERRTRHTVGARCAAAGLVVVGRRTGEVLAVDAVLQGEATGPVALPPVPRDFDGSEGLTPAVHDGERALVFAVAGADGAWVLLDRPGAAVGERSVDDLDAQVQAATWFARLPHDDARVVALVDAADDGNPATVSSALRALGDEQLHDATTDLMTLALASDVPALPAVLAAVALWLLDEHARASAALAGTVDRLGRDRFLELWGVQESADDPVLLVAPDPDLLPYA
ncbi:hypothetical protein [Cellulomonas sp. Leaf334]|uniref:hypothetical protein n=1 Tax=Cellulomonas sp. Leaf334 TaxID=1736339 RepID=UPI0006FF96E6|nr:hypothetical protein [Cellulomonas sp. Leaf334]KQR17394.1 hypothetical protein ASF78_08925 [Cellulomonas sp. Leaf334]